MSETRDYSAAYSSRQVQETPKQEIHRLYAELRTIGQTAVTKAIRIGQILTTEHAKVKHGDWLLWVESNAPFNARMASNYMRLFENKDKVSNRHSIADALLALQPLTVDSSSASCEEISPPKSAVPPPPKSAEDFEKHHAGNDGAPVVAKKGKPEPEVEPETPEPPKDDLGQVIPQRCLVVWNRRDELQKVLSAASDVQAVMKRLTAQDTGQHDLLYAQLYGNLQSALEHAHHLYHWLDRCKPARVCPKCKGKGGSCDPCKGVGLVSKYVWKYDIVNGTDPNLSDVAKKIEG